MGNSWATEVNVYDIEKAQFVNNELIEEELPEALVGPSMSAEFFGNIGLIVCGQNDTGKTVVYLFDVY